jgi:hypothetical protein
MSEVTFPNAISQFVGPQMSRRIGTVVSLVGTTCTVSVGETEFIVNGYLSSYTPVAGHIVFLLREDASWLLLGRIIGPS